ncbi:MAG: membrane protein insertion efficiency factor YidD [Patescibacteria group bacterium]
MKKIINFLINIYKNLFSSLIKSIFGGGCRYNPTCSDYARIAISKKGIIKGSMMSVNRVLRCSPFGGWGEDSVIN